MKLKLLSFLITSFWLVQNLAFSQVFAIETCPAGSNRYRPGGNCEKTSPLPSHNQASDYPLSCIPASNITYKQVVTDPNQVPNQVTVSLNVNLSEAELGDFGPNANTLNSKTPDSLAKAYPFNSLFDRPPNTSPFNPREAFRTYWRLLSTYQQANSKAKYLHNVKTSGQTNNLTYKFFNQQNKEQELTVLDLYDQLPNCLKKYPVCSDYQEKYLNLNQNIRDAYDALMPFNFDNLQAFLVLNNSIVTENIPYLNALNQGINDPQTGLIYTLSSSWSQKNITDRLTSLKATGVNRQQLIDLANKVNCPTVPQNGLTNLPAPKTFPSPTYLNQQVTFNNLSVTQQTIGTESSCKGAKYCANLNETNCKKYSTCTWTSKPIYQYTVTGQGKGDPIVIFNHPFVNNITNSLVSGANSLYKMLLPDFSQPPKERTIDAPNSTFTVSSPYPNSTVSVTTSNNSDNMPIYRKTALAKDSLCQLQNKWLIPQGQQRPGNCDSLEIPVVTPSPSACGEIKMHLFEPSCAGQVCHQLVINQAASPASACNGKVLNPYFAIAIALNEDGGLLSSQPDGSNIKHFGCDPFGTAGVGLKIEDKLACMINTLRNDCQAGKTDQQTLTEYGYQPGNNLENLISLLEGPSHPRLFVTPVEAGQYSTNLTKILTTGKDQSYWTVYYSGFIQNFCSLNP